MIIATASGISTLVSNIIIPGGGLIVNIVKIAAKVIEVAY